MRGARFGRRGWLLGLVGLAATVLVGGALGGGGDETPAPPAVLNRIAHKNQDAALDAAARMKAQSAASSREAALRANLVGPEAPAATAPEAQAGR